MNYQEVVQALEARGMMPDRPPSLEPMHEGLRLIGFDRYCFSPDRVIVVAGTNGKGSTCASLEALLVRAGERVGLYTSPHLVETTERYRLNGVDISQEQFCLAYEQVERDTRSIALTHFELLTLMAAWHFCSGQAIKPVDWLILEVGLGGTWDATNAIPHSTSVITALGMDHENLLGSTIAEIAANKFGIVGPGNLVVHAPLPPEAKPVAEKVRAQTQSHWVESTSFEYSVRSLVFLIKTRWGKTELALPGLRGAQNAALALTICDALGFNPEPLLPALPQVQWPGRMERVDMKGAPCPVYLSGDHNPQGIASLLELLLYYPRTHLHVLIGVGRDKAFAQMMESLRGLSNSTLYLTETPYRGFALKEYGPTLTQVGGSWAEPLEAMKQVMQLAKPGEMILVTGSLYLVGKIRGAILEESRPKGA